MTTTFHRVLLVAACFIFSGSAISQERQAPSIMNVDIATRMVEDGRTNNDVLHLFYFSYSVILGEAFCSVVTLEIVNPSCSKTLPGMQGMPLPTSAPQISKPFFCDNRECGLGRLSCARKGLGDGKFEYNFQFPHGLGANGRSSHRLVIQMQPHRGKYAYSFHEYSGSLHESQGLDRTIKSAKYAPLLSSPGRNRIQELSLGCSKISVPALGDN